MEVRVLSWAPETKYAIIAITVPLGESPPPVDALDESVLRSVIKKCLTKSEKFGVRCVDLEQKIVDIVKQWFEEKKEELSDDFTNTYPQTRPAKQNLLERINNDQVLPLERITYSGSGLAFRRTKVTDHWVGEIYHNVLEDIFRG